MLQKSRATALIAFDFFKAKPKGGKITPSSPAFTRILGLKDSK